MEPGFANAGKKEGLEIWRIEDFKAVAYPEKDYGKFYTGDSYIVLSTRENRKGEQSWDVHFWLGAETTQDESGTAAILSTKLDDQLGGAPVQHREVQDHESQVFLSYFPSGIRYLPGGVSSGFQHVDRDAFETRLFQVKGSRNVRVKQVDVSIKSMNRGDCFILDAGHNIYVYEGSESKRSEKMKAIAAANQIRDQDHSGKAKIDIIDEFSSSSDLTEFFNALGGGAPDLVPEASAGGDDAQFEQSQERSVTLFRVSDASGSLTVEQVGQKPLKQSLLDGNDCFILNTSDSNLFVWVGKHCTDQEKREAMARAQKFLEENNYPAWSNVQRLVEGAETTAFTQYFQSWKGRGNVNSRLTRTPSTEVSGDEWEPRLFHAKIQGKDTKFQVEEVVGFTQKDLVEDDVMMLDLGEEVYVWIGNGANVRERTRAADVAKLHLKKLERDHAEIIRINQGEEPPKFKKAFGKWNDNMKSSEDIYHDLKAKLIEHNNTIDN